MERAPGDSFAMAGAGVSVNSKMGRRDAGGAGSWIQYMRLSYNGWVTGPDADDGIFDCLLVSMATRQETDRKASFVFIGDFNAHHKEWLNSISQTDYHDLRALDFSSESGCDQIIHNPTHRSGNCLDLIFTDTPGLVAGNVGSPVIGTSDHCYVSAIIKTEHAVPDISFFCKIYVKSQPDCDGF